MPVASRNSAMAMSYAVSTLMFRVAAFMAVNWGTVMRSVAGDIEGAHLFTKTIADSCKRHCAF